MNIFSEIGATYFELDNAYASKELDARSKGYRKKEVQFQKKRILNDHAYFLFMFTRLEDKIISLSTALINSKISSISNYKNKRGWEILNSKRLSLLEKVSFFTIYLGPDYNLIKNYKRDRDTIAHGGTLTVINMHRVIADMTRLYNALR